MPLTIGPFGHCKGGPLAWSHYPDGGADALVCMDRGDAITMTANLYAPPPPPVPPNHVWLKVWSGHEGVVEALVEAGVIYPATVKSWRAGHVISPCHELTPEAIADRDADLARNPDRAKAQAAARARVIRQGIG